MATDMAKQQVEKAVTERLLGGGAQKGAAGGTTKDTGKSGGGLGDALKGLFGR
jgi:hypothetical protein